MASEHRAAGTPPLPTLEAAIRTLVRRNLPWLGTTIVVTLVYWQLDPAGEAWWAVPVLLFAGLWLVLQGLNERADLRAVSSQGGPRDGQWVAVSGKAVALEEPDGEILACRFEIYDKEPERDILKQRYDGFYLRPAGLETDSGVVPLAGFPDMIHYEKRALPGDMIASAKASAFQCPYWMPPYLASEIVLSGMQDRIETSLRYRDGEDGDEREIKSWMLNAGDQVCVFGIWRGGALHPSPQRPRGLPVYAGTPAEVREHLGDTTKFVLGLGVILLTAAFGLAVWSLV